MDREERLHKLKNGSDTAIWAANEIERLTQENLLLLQNCYRLRKELDEATGVIR